MWVGDINGGFFGIGVVQWQFFFGWEQQFVVVLVVWEDWYVVLVLYEGLEFVWVFVYWQWWLWFVVGQQQVEYVVQCDYEVYYIGFQWFVEFGCDYQCVFIL